MSLKEYDMTANIILQLRIIVNAQAKICILLHNGKKFFYVSEVKTGKIFSQVSHMFYISPTRNYLPFVKSDTPI